MGFFRKTAGSVWSANPYTAIKGYIHDGLNPHERKYAREIRQQSWARIKQHSQNFRHDSRDPWAAGAPDMSDFGQVLDHWGVTREQLPFVRKALAIKATAFALLAAYGLLWLIVWSDKWWIIGWMTLFTGSAIAICNGWRAQVLYREKFTFFKDWFLWGLFDCFGDETPIAQAKRLAEEAEEERLQVATQTQIQGLRLVKGGCDE